MKFTREEVARDAGVPLESVRVLWRSMGYADVGDRVGGVHRRGCQCAASHAEPDPGGTAGLWQPPTWSVASARPPRLADWQINSLAGLLERSGMIEPADGLAASTLEVFADEVEAHAGPRSAAGLRVARGVATAVTSGCGRGRGLTVRLGVPPAHRGFADMVGYAAVPTVARGGTRQTGAGFEAVLSADIVAAADGRLVKSVGDEVLFVASTAEQAAGSPWICTPYTPRTTASRRCVSDWPPARWSPAWVTCSAPR